jgi:hypothetical protein
MNGRRLSNGTDSTRRLLHREDCGGSSGVRSSRPVPNSSRPQTQRVRFPDEDRESVDGTLDSLFGLITAALATACSAGLFTMLVLMYLTIRPFSLAAYRRLASQLGASSILDALALLLPNTRICLSGDSDIPSPVGTSILVSNHLMDGDWWALLMLGRCVGLRGSIKFFLRNEYFNLKLHNSDSATSRSNSTTIATSKAVGTAVHIRNENAQASSSLPRVSHLREGSTSHGIAIMANLLHQLLEFPLLSGDDHTADREQLVRLLRSFAHDNASAPVHLLFFPEGWSLHNGADRTAILAKSNEFAQREGRPQLKHLLLPRARGFNASLECLRESSPVVYDVTMAYSGYNGSLPPSIELTFPALWKLLRGFPREIHIRIKRYSMEEVTQDSSWLDQKWAEKDRLLSHFARHQTFPADNRGYCRHRVFDTRTHAFESSIIALGRLLLLPLAVPLFVLVSIPIFWALMWLWLAHWAYRQLFGRVEQSSSNGGSSGSVGSAGAGTTPGTSSASGTPFFPATPFASPTVTSWRDMFSKSASSSSPS